uniref:BPI fold containing family B member 1 n=1 Tax=Catagonus wagneri TaxID=51154 RepID=A0A8C3W5P5_9CETA
MASPRTFTFLCGLLATNLVAATLSPPAVLRIGPEVIKEKLTQKLKDRDAVHILQQLPLLSAMQESSQGVLAKLVSSILKHILWLKVTSASILQLQVLPLPNSQELLVKIPLDMVAGFNTPLVKTIVQLHMEAEAEAVIHLETSEVGEDQLVLSDCSNTRGSLRISLLHKLSFFLNSIAENVIKCLVPALPKLVKSELCPVVREAFGDVREDLLNLVKLPTSLNSDLLEFELLSPAIDGSAVQFNLGAKLLDSEGNVIMLFNDTVDSLNLPVPSNVPFSLVVRKDVVNAVVAALLPPEELMVLLDYVLPELARRLKLSIRVISKEAADKLGPTQIAKILTQDTPEFLVDRGSARAAQLIVLEIFPTSEVRRPLFTVGIEASSEAQFYTEDDHLMLHFNDISSDRIHLMNSDIGLFNPELLKNITAEILVSILLPHQNGKLRSGIPVSMVKALGYETASWSLVEDALVITSASSNLHSPLFR